jgi:hypothetical protein
VIQYPFCDASPAVGLGFTINITSPGGKSSTTSMEIAPNSASAYSDFVPFSDLHGNATPSAVDSITFVFNVNQVANADYMLQLLGTASSVPEPAGGTLLTIAFGILIWPKFRLRAAAKLRITARPFLPPRP